MKKRLMVIATVCVVALTAVSVTSAASGPTVVDEGFACNVYDGNGNLFVTFDSELLLYSSGKAVLRCEGNGAPAPTLTHFNFANTGVLCGMLEFGTTTNWDNKVGYNGNSQLTCTTFVEDGASASSGSAGIAG